MANGPTTMAAVFSNASDRRTTETTVTENWEFQQWFLASTDADTPMTQQDFNDAASNGGYTDPS